LFNSFIGIESHVVVHVIEGCSWWIFIALWWKGCV